MISQVLLQYLHFTDEKYHKTALYVSEFRIPPLDHAPLFSIPFAAGISGTHAPATAARDGTILNHLDVTQAK